MMIMEATEQYALALKRGQKYCKTALGKGEDPYPQVLDELLEGRMTAGRVDLGQVEIPSELIVGTLSKGRQAAFSGDFMPLLEENTEFASKWILLCADHLGDEGIRDPIRCYEYLGNFYIAEGNKRVSVLRSYDAPRIPGYVTRVLPLYSEDPKVKLYYEFLRFYPLCDLYQIRFSRPGSYEKLQSAMGFSPEHVWTEAEKRAFSALLYRIDQLCSRRSLPDGLSSSDALLGCLQVFPFVELKNQTDAELHKTLDALWTDVKSSVNPQSITVSTEPVPSEKGLLSRIIGLARPEHLQVAFVYGFDPETSAWTRAHMRGEEEMQNALGGKVEVKRYWALNREYDDVMARAVEEGADILFATTPPMLAACRKIAALHPTLRVMNCSLSQPYTGLRTYYSRTYEAKFVTGAIAGAMAEENRIGYIASYPIAGVPASINAFALGAQMTNPRARIELLWSSETDDALSILRSHGITVISNRDANGPEQRHWTLDSGTYRISPDGSMQPLALPCWNWGSFYTQVIQSVFNGGWDALGKTQQAINYWWGMGSGVIELQLSPSLPDGIRRLAEHLCHDLSGGWFDPFLCRIRDQNGVLRSDGQRRFSPEEIMQMNWLCENVEGSIPGLDQLRPEAVETAKILAIPQTP